MATSEPASAHQGAGGQDARRKGPQARGKGRRAGSPQGCRRPASEEPRMATSEPASMSDEVRLAVPATPEFVRLARVTAAGLASRLGFTFDDVDDLRLAIDELCF